MKRLLSCVVFLLIKMVFCLGPVFAQQRVDSSPVMNFLSSYSDHEDEGFLVHGSKVYKDADGTPYLIYPDGYTYHWPSIKDTFKGPLIPYSTEFKMLTVDTEVIEDDDYEWDIEEWFDDLVDDDDRYEKLPSTELDDSYFAFFFRKENNQIKEVTVLFYQYDDYDEDWYLSIVADFIGVFPADVLSRLDLKNTLLY